MSSLEPHLIDALRADQAVPSDAKGRVRARLEAALPEMRRGPRGGSNGGAGAGLAGALGSRMLSAVALFVAGGVTGAALLSAVSGSRPARIVYVDRVPPSAVAEASSVAPPPFVDEAPPSIARPAASADPAASRSQDARALSTSRASRLAAERRLLDEARASAVAGDSARAVERLEHHRALFPDGLLAEERDAMLVEALVSSSRYAEARALAATFRARWPGSLFSSAVDSALASIR